MVTFTTTQTVVAPTKTVQGQDRSPPVSPYTGASSSQDGNPKRSPGGGMRAVMVERAPLTVPTRRKTVAQEEKGPTTR